MQDDLDDPFDGFGQDDIDLNMFSDWVAVALYKNVPAVDQGTEYRPSRELKSKLYSQGSFRNLVGSNETIHSAVDPCEVKAQAQQMRASIYNANEGSEENISVPSNVYAEVNASGNPSSSSSLERLKGKIRSAQNTPSGNPGIVEDEGATAGSGSGALYELRENMSLSSHAISEDIEL